MTLTMDKKLNDVAAFDYRNKWKGDEKNASKELSVDFNNATFHLDSIAVKNTSDPDQDLLNAYSSKCRLY